MDDYYGYHLGLTLKRPLVIASLPGGRGDDVAYGIASVTSIPVTHIDERIMHRLGTDLASYVVANSTRQVISHKEYFTASALQRTPHSIIALGDLSLVSESCWAQINGNADVVGIQWTNLELLSALKHPNKTLKRQYWQTCGEPIEHLSQIEVAFAEQKQALRQCQHLFDGMGRSAAAIAREVIEHLGIE